MQPTAKPVRLYFSPTLWFILPLIGLAIAYICYVTFGFTYHHVWLVVAILLLLGFILAYPIIEIDDEKVVYKRLCNIGNWQLGWQDIQRVYAVAKPMSQNSKIDSHFDIVFATENAIKRFSTSDYLNKQQFFDFLPIKERLTLTAYQDLTLKQEYSWEIIAGLFYLCSMVILPIYIYYDDLLMALHLKPADRSFWLNFFWNDKPFLWCGFYLAIYSVNQKIASYVPLKIRPNFSFTFGGLMIFLWAVISILPAWLRYYNEQSPISQPVYECSFDFSDGFYYQTWQCQNPQNQHIVKFSVHDDDKIYNKALKRNQVYLLKISEGKLNDFFIQPQDFQKIETR